MVDHGSPSPARTWLFRVAAAGLALGLCLLLLEAGLRLAPPAWLAQRMRELSPGRHTRPGTDRQWPVVRENGRFRQFVPGSSFVARHYEYEHAITIDELGGRLTPYSFAYDRLVPFYGDSFTLGLGVDDSETFLALLADHSRHRLLNLGVTGSGLHDHLNVLPLRHHELGSPSHYVFVLFLGNDLDDIRARHGRPSASHDRLWRANTAVTHHPVLNKLYLLQFLRRSALAALQRGRRGYMQPVFRAMRTDLEYLDESLVYLRLELERLRQISTELGFDFFFVLIPDVYQLDHRRLEYKAKSLGLDPSALDPERPTRAVSVALHDLRIQHVDLEPCLAEGWTDGLYYLQDTHLTAAGHARAAECLLREDAVRSLLATADPAGHHADASPLDITP